MFEMLGLLIGLAILCGLSALAGGVIAAFVWILFWGHKRPKFWVFCAGALPLASLAYLILCATCLEIFVPNQPDLFFGDFTEPLPNGYILTGLGKMPEYSYFESTPPMMHPPPLLGGVRRLEQDGQTIFGAYGHLDNQPYDGVNKDRSYFIFDTRTGTVTNLKSIEELNAAAGHSVHLVDSQLFRSQDPGRIRLRKIENAILFGPPVVVTLIFFFFVLRRRFQEKEGALNH